MNIHFRRKKIKYIFYKIPYFFTTQELEVVSSVIDHIESYIGQPSVDFDRNDISEIVGQRKIALGLYDLLFKVYYKNSNKEQDSSDPFIFRKQLFSQMAKDGVSWVPAHDQENYFKSVNYTNNVPIYVKDGKCLFSDHVAYEKIYRINGVDTKPNAKSVISGYNKAVLRSLFSKTINLTIQINNVDVTSQVIKTMFRNAKLCKIYFELEFDDRTLTMKFTGPKQLVGRSTKYGFRLFTYFKSILHLLNTNFNAELEIELFNRKEYVWMPINILMQESIFSIDPTSLMTTTSEDDLDILSEEERDMIIFDSKVEENFSHLFNKSCPHWKISREPLLSINNEFFIPDFELRFNDQVVYLEIVGFWTESYLSKKLDKLNRFKLKFNNLIILFDENLAFNIEGIQSFSYNKKFPIQEIREYLHKNFEKQFVDQKLEHILLDRDQFVATLKYKLIENAVIQSNQIIEILGVYTIENAIYLGERLFPGIINDLNVIFVKEKMMLISRQFIQEFDEKLEKLTQSKFVEEQVVLEEFSFLEYGTIQVLMQILGYYADFQSLLDIVILPPMVKKEIIPQMI